MARIPIAACGLFAAAGLLSGCAEQDVFKGVVGVDLSPPAYVSARATAAAQLSVEFSEAVSLVSVRFDPELRVASSVGEASLLRIEFDRPLETGRRYVMDLSAADAEGNTLTVLAPFYGRNDRPPALVINELRVEYTKGKSEFVELYASKAGNLGGLALSTATAGFGEPLYVFPPVEVTAGEYVLVHLRTLEDGLVDEIGDIGASPGTEASPTARDFWVPGTEKRLRETDVVAVLDTDGDPIDGVVFSEAPDTEWKTEELRAAAEFLTVRGAWKGGAALSAGCTPTRTLGRNAASGDGDTKEDWRVVDTSGATPGCLNAETTYVPKKR